MAKDKTPEPPPPPPPPKPVSTPAMPAVVKSKTGFDFWRPFRYAKGFIGGFFEHTLNGMANGGRKGMWFGTGIGALAMLAGVAGGFGLVVMGWVAGLAIGAIMGGGLGALTGGFRGAGVEFRRDKYSEDLLAKATAKSHPQPRADYREAHREYERAEGYNLDRTYQQEREIKQETNTYFQDRELERRHFNHERGI